MRHMLLGITVVLLETLRYSVVCLYALALPKTCKSFSSFVQILP